MFCLQFYVHEGRSPLEVNDNGVSLSKSQSFTLLIIVFYKLQIFIFTLIVQKLCLHLQSSYHSKCFNTEHFVAS